MSIFLSQFPYSAEKQLNKVEELDKLMATSNCPVQMSLFRILNCLDTMNLLKTETYIIH